MMIENVATIFLALIDNRENVLVEFKKVDNNFDLFDLENQSNNITDQQYKLISDELLNSYS